MDTILLEEKYILEYIKDTLLSFKSGSYAVNNAKFHHNTDYCDAPSICKYGILTMNDLKNKEIKSYTSEGLQRMSDIESHINGIDAVSLSVVGLKDLYPDEYEYDPYTPNEVDFLVSSDISAGRSTIHYGNEFLCRGSINVDKLRSVDIRLLELIEIIEKRPFTNESIEDTIKKYNYLKEIALTMDQLKLNIPLRETSYQDKSLIDIEKISSSPRLVLKS